MVVKELPFRLLSQACQLWLSLPKVKLAWRGEKLPEQQDSISLSAGQRNSRLASWGRAFSTRKITLHKLKNYFNVCWSLRGMAIKGGAYPSRKVLALLPG